MINRKELLKDYMAEIDRICDLEEMEFKVSFSPEEIIDILCTLMEGGEIYGKKIKGKNYES